MFDALRKARARAEIDRLTNGPDAIYGLPSDTKEAEIEMRFDKLEFSMTRAVDKNDFGTAAKARDEINRMHVEEVLTSKIKLVRS